MAAAARCVAWGWVPRSHFEEAEAYLFIGLPAAAVLQLLSDAAGIDPRSWEPEVRGGSGGQGGAAGVPAGGQEDGGGGAGGDAGRQEEGPPISKSGQPSASPLPTGTASSSPPAPLAPGGGGGEGGSGGGGGCSEVVLQMCSFAQLPPAAASSLLHALADHVLAGDIGYSGAANPVRLHKSLAKLKVRKGAGCAQGALRTTRCWLCFTLLPLLLPRYTTQPCRHQAVGWLVHVAGATCRTSPMLTCPRFETLARDAQGHSAHPAVCAPQVTPGELRYMMCHSALMGDDRVARLAPLHVAGGEAAAAAAAGGVTAHDGEAGNSGGSEDATAAAETAAAAAAAGRTAQSAGCGGDMEAGLVEAVVAGAGGTASAGAGAGAEAGAPHRLRELHAFTAAVQSIATALSRKDRMKGVVMRRVLEQLGS